MSVNTAEQLFDYRILYGNGPGDSFSLVEDRAPGVDHEDALRRYSISGRGGTGDGRYLVQNKKTLVTRLFKRNPRPTFMEI